MANENWAQSLQDCKDPSDYAYCTCAVYSCGYSQPHRDWLTETRLKNGTAETDCSYGVGWWLWKGGFLTENPAFHTAIELDYLVAHGFTAIDANAGFVSLERNDVLLRSGHTALYIGDGMQAEALRDEHHQAGYEGTTPGDQDGGETVVRKLTYDWDWVLRKRDQPTPAPDPMPGPSPMDRRLVLDIWHGNKGIDLQAWRSRHNVWAVIAKCGGSDDDYYGRYEESTFVDQCQQARSCGMHVGAYYYSDALTKEDALLDARHCVEKCLRNQELDMPVYLDIEEPSQLRLPMDRLTEVVTTFCEYVRNAGYYPGIYSGYDGFHNMFEDDISDYALWVAAWRSSWPTWAKDYGMWQEGSMRLSDGDIKHDDVTGYVDCNWCQMDYPAIIDGGGTMAASPIGILYHAEGEDPNYYWNWSPECVPFHVSKDQKEAIERLTGLKLQRISKADADAIMQMCKDRKAWREQGIKNA